MRIEWDEAKQKANLRKHGIEFADAVSALDDPRAISIEDCGHDEQQFVTLGMDALGRLLVVYTHREPDTLRIISARKAESHECRQYED